MRYQNSFIRHWMLALLIVLGLVLAAWQFVTVLLLAFVGLLLAVLLRHLARMLSRQVPLPVGACLAAVLIEFFLVVARLAGPPQPKPPALQFPEHSAG